jgi:hypothetical protein
MKMRRIVMAVLLFIVLTTPAFAGEISFLGGYGATNNPVQKAGAYQVEYLEGLGENLAWSVSYLNQGHFIEHHRDGNAATLWLRTNRLDRQLSLGVGVGGVFYYDTIIPPAPAPASDFHGWGTIVNVAASWYTESRIIFQVRGSWIRGGQSFDTLSALAGIGYQLDPPTKPGPVAWAAAETRDANDNELTVLGGETVVNIPSGIRGRSTAASLEYRRRLFWYLEFTAGALYEGKNDLINRYGLTTELWLTKSFFNEHLALSAGGGAYFAEDERRDPVVNRSSGVFLSEIASISSSFRLTPHWAVRATWDRIITSYNRDTDLFLGGIGYRF